jgi:hypothetical protein
LVISVVLHEKRVILMKSPIIFFNKINHKTQMFCQRQLNLDLNYNDIRSSNVHLEEMCPGRSGANFLADEDSIVRTTTSFTLPNQLISPLHTQIMRAVCDSFPEQHDLKFNNILIEEYDDRYRTMSYHSDQSLDLVDSSFIAIYSCYRHQGNQQQHHKNPSRSLFIKDKEARGSAKPIILPLFHNSAVLFSTSTNASYLHKIVLTQSRGDSCIFITFRLSKGCSRKTLALASDHQRDEFFRLRRKENSKVNFKWPENIYYSISPGDLLPIVGDGTTAPQPPQLALDSHRHSC